jgi:hypothetical protein
MRTNQGEKMNKYQEINKRMEEATEAYRNEDNGTEEERRAAFFSVTAELFNEHVTGDITLADGRVAHIFEI